MAFTNKKISINGANIFFNQNSLKTKLGKGETSHRVQVSGNTTQVIPYDNLESRIGEVVFDILTSDSDSDTDPRVLISNWKANIGNNQIVIEPDGVGQTELYNNASLMNDPDINDSPDGVISLTFHSSPAILTN